VRNIREAGSLVIGKTNLHPWAFGVTGENPHFGDALNPRDPKRVAGGSSGGSAIAVATRMCAWAIGTDTGGSIRIPASLCGVVGFKPTFGSLSVDGVLPLSRSLDTVGALAPSVAVAAAAFDAMSGRPSEVADAARGFSDLRLATPARWVDGLDEETGRTWRAVASGLPELELPDRATGSQAALTVLYAEGASLHRNWIERYSDRYPADVLAKLRRGLLIAEAEYEDAVKTCARFREDMEAAMSGWDALLLPATACVAPLLGQAGDLTEPLTRFTRPFNATGQPVAVVPAPDSLLPVGVQVIGHVGEDTALLRVAAAVERVWRTRAPA
jgi:aspartyl-tRNA(Asn)/glutamyl-tRNA(Gln) amidotransferase subunit A